MLQGRSTAEILKKEVESFDRRAISIFRLHEVLGGKKISTIFRLHEVLGGKKKLSTIFRLHEVLGEKKYYPLYSDNMKYYGEKIIHYIPIT